MVVTQPDNIFGGDFAFVKRYFSKSEKQQITFYFFISWVMLTSVIC